MPSAPTVLEASRSSLLALPLFIAGVCLVAVASVVVRGIPHDTSTRVAVAIFALAGVASVFWSLRWRHIRPARLTIDHQTIVMTPLGRGRRTREIARRSDSQLRVKFVSDGTASPTAFNGYVLYDEAVGRPRIPIDIYGAERVKAACRNHGWVVRDA